MPIQREQESKRLVGTGYARTAGWWVVLAALVVYSPNLAGQSGAPGVSPVSQQVLGGGGMQSAAVAAPSGASWSASSNVAWITFPGLSSGTGNGALQYQVDVHI